MLDPASVPQPKPAMSPASAGSTRSVAKEEAGFHGALREALEAPDADQQAPQAKGEAKVEAKGEDRRSADRLEPQTSSAEAKTQPENDPGVTVAAPRLEGLPIQDPAPVAPAEELLTNPAIADVTVNGEAVVPASLVAVDMAASLGLPQPAIVPLAAQGAVGVPGAQSGTDGSSPQSASASGPAAIPVDAKAAMVAKQLEGGGILQPSEIIMAQTGSSPDAEAQALLSVEQLRRQTISVQQGSASRAAPEVAPGQEQMIANALAAGSAQAQAAVSQGAQTQQTTPGARKSGPSAEAVEAAERAKPAASLASLATALNKIEAAAEATFVVAGETKEAALHLAAVEAAAPAGAKPSGDARADAPSLQPLGLAAPDGMLQRMETPQAGAAARDVLAPPPARQLAPVVVSLVLGRGDEALTIALDPVELGRVEVSIGRGKEAGQVRIVAERPETLALLQRDQRELDRALNQAGLGDMARSMSFSLASDQGRQQQQHAAHQAAQRFASAMGGAEAERPPIVIPIPARAANSLLDIAV